jgi:hypothetical protein
VNVLQISHFNVIVLEHLYFYCVLALKDHCNSTRRALSRVFASTSTYLLMLPFSYELPPSLRNRTYSGLLRILQAYGRIARRPIWNVLLRQIRNKHNRSIGHRSVQPRDAKLTRTVPQRSPHFPKVEVPDISSWGLRRLFTESALCKLIDGSFSMINNSPTPINYKIVKILLAGVYISDEVIHLLRILK